MLLTVCLSNYNHCAYLEKRISTLLAGMPTNSELLITDDGSTDNSVSVLKALAQKDARIDIRINPENRGVISNVNEMLARAQGKYISFVAADDMHEPEFYKKLLNLTEKHPGYGVYCSDFAMYKTDTTGGRYVYQSLLPNAKEVQLIPAKLVPKLCREQAFWIPGHASIFETELVREFTRFEQKLEHHCDFLINNGCALKRGVVFLPEYLSAWRLDGTNYSDQDKASQKKVELSVMQLLYLHENTHLLTLFRRSHLLRGFIKSNLPHFCARPKYWSLLFHLLTRSFINRSKIFLKKLTRNKTWKQKKNNKAGHAILKEQKSSLNLTK